MTPPDCANLLFLLFDLFLYSVRIWLRKEVNENEKADDHVAPQTQTLIPKFKIPIRSKTKWAKKTRAEDSPETSVANCTTALSKASPTITLPPRSHRLSRWSVFHSRFLHQDPLPIPGSLSITSIIIMDTKPFKVKNPNDKHTIRILMILVIGANYCDGANFIFNFVILLAW